MDPLTPTTFYVGTGCGGAFVVQIVPFPIPTLAQWLTSLLLGQCLVSLGPLVYALLIGPLVPDDGVDGFLAGILTGAMLEGYRRSR